MQPRRVVALEGGEALVADYGWTPQRVYHLDHHGDVIPPWHTVSTLYKIKELVEDGGAVCIIQSDGTITQTHLDHLDHMDWKLAGVGSYLGGGCLFAHEVLLLTDRDAGEAFTYNLNSRRFSFTIE